MKKKLRINPIIGILFAGLLLAFCTPGQPTDGREEIPADVVEEAGNIPVEVDTTAEDHSDINPPPLPDNGIVHAKGSLSDYTQACGEAPCSCETVTLARVQTKNHTGWSGGLFGSKYGIFTTPTPTYDTDIHYELGDSQNPPETGPLEFPERTHMDQMCFYFTYPSCYAYWGREGARHPCRVYVEIEWPSAASSSGSYKHTWQLYGIRGVHNFATGTPNYICYVSAPEGFEVVPGKGKIKWNVNGRVCDPEVEFTVVDI